MMARLVDVLCALDRHSPYYTVTETAISVLIIRKEPCCCAQFEELVEKVKETHGHTILRLDRVRGGYDMMLIYLDN